MKMLDYLNYLKDSGYGLHKEKVLSYTSLFLMNGNGMEWTELGTIDQYERVYEGSNFKNYYEDIFLNPEELKAEDFFYNLDYSGFSLCYPLPKNIDKTWKEAIYHFIDTMIIVHNKELNTDYKIPKKYYDKLVLASKLQEQFNTIKEEEKQKDLESRGWTKESLEDMENLLKNKIFGY